MEWSLLTYAVNEAHAQRRADAMKCVSAFLMVLGVGGCSPVPVSRRRAVHGMDADAGLDADFLFRLGRGKLRLSDRKQDVCVSGLRERERVVRSIV
jgi:hypothetical protein